MIPKQLAPDLIRGGNRFSEKIMIKNDNQPGRAMRAEVQAIVDEIKQSVGLLRRHL
jgi:hypothetical protein